MDSAEHTSSQSEHTMPKRLDRPTTKTSLRLFSSDLAELREAYQAVGYNEIVRALVARHVRRLRAKTAEHLADSPELLTKEDLNVV